MFQNRVFKIGELISLFIALPILLMLDIGILYKVLTVVIGIIYCIWVSNHLKIVSKKHLLVVDFKDNILRIIITFVLISISSLCYMYAYYPDNLFIVAKRTPLLWVMILFVYTLFSALPQELLYRTYYFKRYSDILSPKYLIVINILIFPIAHLMFHNDLVLLVTLIGGALFTINYYRHQSTILISIEHALYGNILFTVGMGEMLAFPMP